MMNYEMFKGVIEAELVNYLPESMKEAEIRIELVPKINHKREAVVVNLGQEGKQVCPTIYLDDMFERYNACGSLPEVMKTIADAFATGMEKAPDIKDMVDINNCKDKIIFQLINTEQNKELLENVPYRPFQDLAIIYRVVVEEMNQGLATAIITNKMADALGIKEDELFRLAAENTKRINPVKVAGMNEVLRSTFASTGASEEELDMMFGMMPKEEVIYVITNTRQMNGAISMMYEDNLHELAQKLGDDLYILPSSIHEVLAVAVGDQTPEELADMVHIINMGQVNLEDRLSNQVYHYDKEARTLELATDTPNKRLDGEVSEQKLIYETGKGHRR